MFDVVQTTLAAQVADNGTFTVAYPTDRTAGSYTGGRKHKMFVNQSVFQAPGDFTVSFGASEITVTWLANTTLAANTPVAIEFDRLGSDSNPVLAVLPARLRQSPLMLIDLGAPDTADADGISVSQSVTVSTTPLATITGAYASGGVATLDVPRNVVGAWTGAAVLTVTGKDEYGNTVVEASASGTSFTGKKAFKKVTSVSFSADVTGATVGTGDVLGLPVRLPEKTHVVSELQDGAVVAERNALFTVGVTSPSLADAGQVYGVVPRNGELVEAYAVTNTVVATADAGITVKNGANTVGAIVIALSGTAVGVVDVIDAIANANFAEGDTIEFENDGAASAGIADYVAVFRPRNGTLVAAVDSAATATTGDVRGTYDPVDACNGSKVFQLLVAVPDPTDRGVSQYAG